MSWKFVLFTTLHTGWTIHSVCMRECVWSVCVSVQRNCTLDGGGGGSGM